MVAARLAGGASGRLDFDEQLVRLGGPGSRSALLEHSPAGKVPILKPRARVIWDSLAIVEYLAEQRPAARLWPHDADARALARSIAAEMHCGLRRAAQPHADEPAQTPARQGPGPGVPDDIARIRAIWQDCRTRFASGGPFLFGAASAADAMYAPVATRFRTYGVTLDPVGLAYLEAIYDWPAFREWQAAALAEPWIIPEDEVE